MSASGNFTSVADRYVSTHSGRPLARFHVPQPVVQNGSGSLTRWPSFHNPNLIDTDSHKSVGADHRGDVPNVVERGLMMAPIWWCFAGLHSASWWRLRWVF